jgi:hypothetical protein
MTLIPGSTVYIQMPQYEKHVMLVRILVFRIVHFSFPVDYGVLVLVLFVLLVSVFIVTT